MAIRYTLSGGTFVADKPRLWLEKLGRVRDGDLAPDGKRMLVIRPVESAEPPKQGARGSVRVQLFRRVAATGAGRKVMSARLNPDVVNPEVDLQRRSM